MTHIFESDTGYIRNKASKVVYKAHVIYLGIYDTSDNYEVVTEREYDEYMESERIKLEALYNDKPIITD